jgi:hypothetical protein
MSPEETLGFFVYINVMDVTAKDENELPLFPGLLPYGHSASAPAFRPNEMGVILSKSAAAMNEQVEMQKKQILDQLELLKKQYTELEERRIISNLVYCAKYGFKPDAGEVYHLYQRDDKTLFLSLIAPYEWSKPDIVFVATVKQLHDMTWQLLTRTDNLQEIVNNFNIF